MRLFPKTTTTFFSHYVFHSMLQKFYMALYGMTFEMVYVYYFEIANMCQCTYPYIPHSCMRSPFSPSIFFLHAYH
jgi:hypothetical protein